MEMFNRGDSAWQDGEKALIRRACEIFGESVAEYPMGPGDDCAVVFIESGAFGGKSCKNLGVSGRERGTDTGACGEMQKEGKKLLLTTDSIILGRHFLEDSPARLVGGKLVRRNVSDIASMGAKAGIALINLICSGDISRRWLDEFCAGVGDSAKKYGVKIVGGDASSVPEKFFCATMTLVGECEFSPLLRRGAKAGDHIFVTGPLGLSYESGKHLNFEPRMPEGMFLAGMALSRGGGTGVSACTDLSDGAASDLKNMLFDGTCALLEEPLVPRNFFCGRQATLDECLCGGEDYELLFTWRGDSSSVEEKFFQKFGRKVYRIGKICDGRELEKAVGLENCAGKIFVDNGKNSYVEFLGEGFSH